MIRLLIITVLRSFKKYWLNTLINIIGLGIGLALSILLTIYIQSENRIDRFNKNYERIFFLSEDKARYLATVAAIGPMIEQNIPDVESFLRFSDVPKCIVKYNDRYENIDQAILCDSSFFGFFDFKLFEGDSKSALVSPLSVVLTNKIAQRIFGEEDPLGKILLLNGEFELRVTGVIEDLPTNTHLKGDIFISFNSLPVLRNFPNIFNHYGMINYKTYLMLVKGSDKKDVIMKINNLTQSEGERLNIDYLKETKFTLSTIKELYFSQPEWFYFKQGNPSIIKIFSALAIAILLIAMINYINLSTSQAFSRSHTLAIKKTMGADRKMIFSQIIFESIIISIIAINLAVVLIELIKPVFNRIMNTVISIGYFENPVIIPLLIACGIFIGFISGIYPAFHISRFNTVQALSKEIVTGRKAILIRSTLAIIQFAVASFLIIGTLTIAGQMKYIRNKDIGFNKDNLLYFPMNNELANKKNVLKQELLKIPSVINVSCSYGSYRLQFERWEFDYNGERITMHIEIADPDYVNTLGIQIMEGRDFLASESDKGNYIINETANKKYFDGKGLGCDLNGNLIVGIAKDYNFQSLHHPIEPLEIINDDPDALVNVRLESQNIEETLLNIRSSIDNIIPGYPVELTFVDQHFNSLYFKELQLGRIFIFFALAAILIACMGVLGFVSYAYQRRSKEICLRKIHGAEVANIIRLLTLEISRNIIIANLIAIPLAWIMMSKWLTAFAFGTGIIPWHFILAIFLTWLIAQLVVFYHTIKTATINPAEIIKAE